jgi:nucleoid DNA-binding protein
MAQKNEIRDNERIVTACLKEVSIKKLQEEKRMELRNFGVK